MKKNNTDKSTKVSQEVEYKDGTDKDIKTELKTRLYTKRFLILGMFAIYAMSNSFQWIQFITLNKVISYYYHVNPYIVKLTFIIYMIAYIPLTIPGTWLLEKKGLRFVVLLGSFGNCLGAWVKCLSISSDSFSITMLGQVIVSISQVSILGMPSHLAAVWFGRDETSRATAIGVLGNQLGLTLGYVIPPLLVTYSSDKNIITASLAKLYFLVAGVTTMILINLIIFFNDQPSLPPSNARIKALLLADNNYYKTLKKLMKNKVFLIILVTYGTLVGGFYAMSSIIIPILAVYYSTENPYINWTGFIFYVSATIGVIVFGLILDKTKRFKESTVIAYIIALFSMICYMGLLEMGNIWMVNFFSAFLGFFIGGYFPSSLELAAEITYPEPIGTVAGLMNASAQVFGLIIVFSAAYLLIDMSIFAVNIIFVALFAVGTILTVLMQPELKRCKVPEQVEDEQRKETVV